MLAPFIVFLLVVAFVVGGYLAATRIPAAMARQRLEERLQEVAQTGTAGTDESVVAQQADGPLPAVDRFVGTTATGSRLARLIDQSGVKTTPSTVLLVSALLAVLLGVLTHVFARFPPALFLAVPLGGSLPFFYLSQKRTRRMRVFEERFPEALDLVSRAIRAGHAFQTALGMVAEELPDPVGPEFKKVFDQQNFGLPLRDALTALAERVPLVDVKFFVTAVAIQRESGGNLAEC